MLFLKPRKKGKNAFSGKNLIHFIDESRIYLLMSFKVTDVNELTSPPPQQYFVALIRGGGKLVQFAKKERFLNKVKTVFLDFRLARVSYFNIWCNH